MESCQPAEMQESATRSLVTPFLPQTRTVVLAVDAVHFQKHLSAANEVHNETEQWK